MKVWFSLEKPNFLLQTDSMKNWKPTFSRFLAQTSSLKFQENILLSGILILQFVVFIKFHFFAKIIDSFSHTNTTFSGVFAKMADFVPRKIASKDSEKVCAFWKGFQLKEEIPRYKCTFK